MGFGEGRGLGFGGFQVLGFCLGFCRVGGHQTLQSNPKGIPQYPKLVGLGLQGVMPAGPSG